jgi:hypothetical protein
MLFECNALFENNEKGTNFVTSIKHKGSLSN